MVIDFKTGAKPSSLSKNTIRDDIQVNLYCLAIRELYGTLPVRASLYYIKENRMVDYFPNEETVGAFTETAKSIISAVCAERFDPTPAYQTCRFCDYADLCGVREGSEGRNTDS